MKFGLSLAAGSDRRPTVNKIRRSGNRNVGVNVWCDLVVHLGMNKLEVYSLYVYNRCTRRDIRFRVRGKGESIPV